MCVTGETSVLRNRQDAEGRFMRDTLGENFFITSTGYKACFTADGRDLEHGGSPERALEAFLAIPEAERAAGAVKVGPLDPVDTATAPPDPPAGGMILKTYSRLMRRTAEGGYDYVGMRDFPLMAEYEPERFEEVAFLFESSADHAWFTREEVLACVPAEPRVGLQYAAPQAVIERLARFHVSPSRVYAEGGEWSRNDIRAAEMEFTVTAVSEQAIELRVSGRVALGTEFDAALATTPNGPLGRGYESEIHGFATFDRSAGRFTRFDLLLLGDSWGRVGDANGKGMAIERPGRNPLLFTFELVSGERPADRLVPMGRTSKLEGHRYFETGE